MSTATTAVRAGSRWMMARIVVEPSEAVKPWRRGHRAPGASLAPAGTLHSGRVADLIGQARDAVVIEFDLKLVRPCRVPSTVLPDLLGVLVVVIIRKHHRPPGRSQQLPDLCLRGPPNFDTGKRLVVRSEERRVGKDCRCCW